MTKLDVSNSSTDSTSGSSSDSSSSGSSSTSSNASSSSDSESSACEIVSGPSAAAAPAPAPLSTPDSPKQKPPLQPKPQPQQKEEANSDKKKEEKTRRASTRSKPDDSTDDDTANKIASTSATLPPRRRSTIASKPKSVAAMAAKKPLPRTPAKVKPPPRPAPKGKETRSTLKKKSIFSPDNSSESESEEKVVKNGVKPKSAATPTKGKGRPRKASADKKPPPIVTEKKEEKNSVNNKENVKRRSGSRSSGPPAKQRPGDEKARSSESSKKATTDSRRSRNDRLRSRDSKTRSSDDKNRSSDDKNRFSDDKNRSSDDKNRSSDDKNRSSDDKNRSSDDKNRSSDDKNRSSDDKNRSSDDKSRSNNDKRRTSNDKTRSRNDKNRFSVDKRSEDEKNRSGDEKASVYSCSSSRSSVDTDSPDTDSEPSIKKDAPTTRTKPAPQNKTLVKNHDGPSDSGENVRIDAPEAALPRKLTRSLSARNMRLLACQSRVATDTDSDNDNDKHNDKVSGQGKRGRRPPAPTPRSPPAAPIEPQERRCPVHGCDSSGHLGGKMEKHLTWDACPVYHNVTPAWCVAAAEERAAANAVRRRAILQMQQRPRTQPSLDQRAYQLKVKDLRSKWRGPCEARERWAAAAEAGGSAADDDPDREPILDGFAPEYDLKLFREAQAQAAVKIEEELGDLPVNRGTRYVVMGKFSMEVWYQSPYPGDAGRLPRLYICEYCLSHHKSQIGIARHTAKCPWRHPPGDEVYRKGRLSVWQVDGRKHKQYCQQLCLLAKFFLDHKTLYYDVEPFLFYVMTLADKEGCHTVGYFSKEKNSFLNYNVSCILTLPPYQRQGYGRLLIDFSYLLTKTEGKVGSPEKPLSDLGLISYRSYWKDALLKRLCSASGSTLCIRDLSRDLAVASYDIVSTLQERGLMKYWKGKHIVLKKQEVLEEYSRRADRVRSVDPACLRWTPPAAPPPPR